MIRESRISLPDIRPHCTVPVLSAPPLRQTIVPVAQVYLPVILLFCCASFNVMLFWALHLPLMAKSHGVTSVVPDQRPVTLAVCASAFIHAVSIVARVRRNTIIPGRFIDYLLSRYDTA